MSEHGPRAHDEEDRIAPDLGAVLADDGLVEAVASGELTLADVSDDVVALLVAWRDQVDAAPAPLHPDLDEAHAALLAAVRGTRWRVPLRVLSPVAAAAAAVGIALVGIGYGAHQSAPGDPLWGVSQVIFTDHSRSVQAAANVTAELATAETAITAGTPDKARTALDHAASELPAVGTGEGRQGLERRHSELEARLGQSTSTAPAPASAAATGSATTEPVPTSAPPATPSSTRPSASPTTNPAPTATSTAKPAPTTTVPPTTVPVPTTDPTSPAPTTSSTPPATSPTVSEPAPPTG